MAGGERGRAHGRALPVSAGPASAGGAGERKRKVQRESPASRQAPKPLAPRRLALPFLGDPRQLPPCRTALHSVGEG